MRPAIAHEEYFGKFASLIELESKAQAERVAARLAMFPDAQAEKSGSTLLELVVADSRLGLGGKCIVQLIKRNRDQAFPWHRFKVGSPAVLTHMNGKQQRCWQAVVCSVDRSNIEVACNELPEMDHLRLDFSSDEVSLRRQIAAMSAMQVVSGRTARLRDSLLDLRPPKFNERILSETIEPVGHLNVSQNAAVRNCLAAEDIAIIHGPPGTGKTTTVVELILQAVARGQRVLATAPSNTAVDNLVGKLADSAARVVRIGHPARVSEHLQQHSLDLLVENDEDMQLVRQMIQEAESLYDRADKFTRARPAPGARREMRREARQLKTDARKIERQIIQHYLNAADVICITLTGDLESLQDRFFDMAVVDESCQAIEPGCWIPVLRCDKLILAGDHCQLPPTVVSKEAADAGLSLSMLERLVNTRGEEITTRLETQYRMHEAIAKFSSDRFYDGSLHADDSVREHLLSDLDGVAKNELTNQPLSFIDTAGSGFEEEVEPEGMSKLNPGEARVVLNQLRSLVEDGVDPDSIAVIAPYAAQVRHLRSQTRIESLCPQIGDVEIDTVDGFQGREKEVVVISFTRSNSIGEIGFLSDVRRMNVALTRARRKLIMIGDSATLCHHEFYKSLLEYFDSAGAYQSVWEFDIVG